MKFVEDSNGNRCYADYFGGLEKAQEALDSLTDCKRCVNCIDCSGCIDCYGCFRCFRCIDCSGCFRCFRCIDCAGCSRCFDCSRCFRCFDCSDCSGCSGCARCSGCSGCSRCFDCSGKSETSLTVPKIENIDKTIYKTCTQPKALDMNCWHTCETTHCRAGWVVTLAGEEGKALETRFGTALAAQLIYRESGSPISPVRFYDSGADALEDMRKRAGL